MATKIRDIIDYYSGHNVPDEIKERVLDRISNTQDDKEANEAFRGRIEEYGTLTESYFRSVCQGDDFALFVDGMLLEHGCQFGILELVVHLDVEQDRTPHHRSGRQGLQHET